MLSPRLQRHSRYSVGRPVTFYRLDDRSDIAGDERLGAYVPPQIRSSYLLLGALPFWASLRRHPGARAMMTGVNAAVVGLLAAALYQPLWTTSVTSPADFGLILVGFVLLTAWRTPPLIVVATRPQRRCASRYSAGSSEFVSSPAALRGAPLSTCSSLKIRLIPQHGPTRHRHDREVCALRGPIVAMHGKARTRTAQSSPGNGIRQPMCVVLETLVACENA